MTELLLMYLPPTCTLLRGELSHLTRPEDVERMLNCNMPSSLRKALMPFQVEGIRFGLQRQGRCLIADEVRGLYSTVPHYRGHEGCLPITDSKLPLA